MSIYARLHICSSSSYLLSDKLMKLNGWQPLFKVFTLRFHATYLSYLTLKKHFHLLICFSYLFQVRSPVRLQLSDFAADCVFMVALVFRCGTSDYKLWWVARSVINLCIFSRNIYPTTNRNFSFKLPILTHLSSVLSCFCYYFHYHLFKFILGTWERCQLWAFPSSKKATNSFPFSRRVNPQIRMHKQWKFAIMS